MRGSTDSRKRVLQANLSNHGGAFSLIYHIQKKISCNYIFDYFSQNEFTNNSILDDILSCGGKVYDKVKSPNKFCKQIYTTKELYNLLMHEKYKVVHIHSDTAWKAAIYLIAAKRAKVPHIIVHSHSSGINGSYRLLNYLLHKLFKAYVTNNSSLQFACSDKSAKWMFLPYKGTRIIKNGINIDKYSFNLDIRIRYRKMLSISKDTIVVGTVGDFSWAKNPEFMYDVFVKMPNTGKFCFLFVGDGLGKTKLKQQIDRFVKEKKIRNKCIFTGQVDDVHNYLNVMDYFILPSRFEGVPISALEAQANGLNVFVSKNIDQITSVSSLFNILDLDVEKWVESILNTPLNVNRDCRKKFLYTDELSIENTANIINKIYDDMFKDEDCWRKDI